MKYLPFLLAATFLAAEAPYEPKPVQDHYSILVNAFQRERWKCVVNEGRFITQFHPYSPFAAETQYYLAQALFSLGKNVQANTYFSDYLKADMTPRYFEEAINAKFAIAKKLEKANPDLATEIYTEISTALPRSDMAAECLYRKAELLAGMHEHKESIDAYQTAIRRFPKSPVAPESYIGIAKVYLTQVSRDFPDPDVLNLAAINIEQFAAAFPGEPRLDDVRKLYLKMREYFAKELYEVGEFYTRTKKKEAAKIYFQSILDKYPDTSYAKGAAKKMAKLS